MQDKTGQNVRKTWGIKSRLSSAIIFGPFLTIYRNWDLFWQLLLRDIQASVRGSVLGIAWIVIVPLVLVAIYTFVFGIVLKSAWASQTQSKLEVPLLYFTGLMVFSFFLEIIMRAPEFLRQNKTYVTRMIFPIEILDWVLVGTAAFKLLISLCLLALFLGIALGRVPSGILLVPIVLLPLIIMVMGLAWIISAIGTYIRDINHALAALGPVLMFMSPIFYSVKQVPEGFVFFYMLNPLSFIIETMRGLIFFDQNIIWSSYFGYCAVALIIFFGGYAFFERVRPGFADVI